MKVLIVLVVSLYFVTFSSKPQQVPVERQINHESLAQIKVFDEFRNNNELHKPHQVTSTYVPLESLIPERYQGSARIKIKELIKQLKDSCPDCGQVLAEPTNPIQIAPFPSQTGVNSNTVLDKDNCSIPKWLKDRQIRLLSYALKHGHIIENNNCDRELFKKLIDTIK